MFASPLGLLALLGVPAVLGLHLFRRRFRPRPVSALFLWADDEDLGAGRRRERLRSSPSLWLELLGAALLGLAFAGPMACSGAEAPHLVVLLDASASMAAEPARGDAADARAERPATAEAARAAVRERIDALPRDARVTLVVSGPRPSVLAGPASLPADAREALASYAPATARHDLGTSLTLARELSGGAGLLLVTDRHAPDEAPEGVEVLAVGRPTDNVGLVHATRVREFEDGTLVERVLVTVQAFTRGPVTRTLVVHGPTRELTRLELQLEPLRREHVAFPLPPGLGPVRLQLEEPDGLATDDAVTLLPEPPRRLRLGSTLPPASARALGLGTEGDPLARLLSALPGSEASAPDRAHLVFAAGSLAAAAPGADSDSDSDASTWTLRIWGAEAEAPLSLVGPFLTDRRHPLLAGTTFEGLVWTADPDLVLPGAPLVSAGALTLLSEQRQGERRLLHLNLDPTRSSLARSPDWAILMANLAEERRRRLPGPESSNVPVGADFVLHGVTPGTFRVRAADGSTAQELRARTTLVVESVPAPGVWEVERLDADGGATSVTRFAAQFRDAGESDLRDRSSGTVGSGTALASVDAATLPLVAAGAALALALLLLDWWLLRPEPNRGPAA